MRISYIETSSTANGLGFRVAVFTQGCPIHCPGCHNPESWDPDAGRLFTEEDKQLILSELSKPYIAGLTWVGGEPTIYIDEITEISKLAKLQFPQKTIWLFTGYSWNHIKDTELVKYVDVAVTEPFILSKRDISANNPFRGSTNQKLIDVKKSLAENKEISFMLN